MLNLDRLIIDFDRGLRTVFGPARSVRPPPGGDLPEAPADSREKRHTAALMRVNHSGEVCAQALYQGQALTARNALIQKKLEQAALEEIEHLAWTESRIAELGGRKSLLNPLWYAGSFAIGAAAGALGDRLSLGFLAETERQVTRHLESHLQRVPQADQKSRALLDQMKADESRHATTAMASGGAELPDPVKFLMKLSSKLMTGVAYWV